MTRARLLSVVVLVPVALTALGGPSSAATVTVAADGSGNYTTIQAALAASPSGTVINVKKGTYRGQVVLSSAKSGVTIQGTTGTATDVVITGNVSQAAAGSADGSATVLNQARDTTFKNLTIANTFGVGSQALALYMKADRQVYDNVRLLGHQDTLLTYGASASTTLRQYIVNSYIEGDVDFIYGNGTLVIDKSTIKSLDRNSSNNGYITAAATYKNNPYGILINASTLTGPSAAQTVALGRCWHPSSSTDASGQVLVRDSNLGSHVRQTGAWQDMSGFSWKTCRFNEYNNSGNGRTNGTSDRPQMSASTAANYTVQKYLAGSDGWNPASTNTVPTTAPVTTTKPPVTTTAPATTAPATTAPATTAPATTAPATTVPATTTGVPSTGACVVTYTVTNQWPGGLQADVTVRNTGATAWNGWTLTWNMPGDQVISAAWNATATQSGRAATASDSGWNGQVAAGATASFGFTATGSTATPATAFQVNGTPCA